MRHVIFGLKAAELCRWAQAWHCFLWSGFPLLNDFHTNAWGEFIPTIPHKLHYISSLAKVPEEEVRWGLSSTAGLIVIFILERGILVSEGFSACHSVQDFPLPGEEHFHLVSAKWLPPFSKAAENNASKTAGCWFEEFLRCGWKHIGYLYRFEWNG